MEFLVFAKVFVTLQKLAGQLEVARAVLSDVGYSVSYFLFTFYFTFPITLQQERLLSLVLRIIGSTNGYGSLVMRGVIG